jgi:hypothetical protein
MRSTFILIFSATAIVASEPVARPDAVVTLTPTALEAVKRAGYETAAPVDALAAGQAGGPAGALTGRTTRVVVRPDGSLRAYLGDEHMTDMVAVKSHGRVATTCSHGADLSAAHAALHGEEK